MTGKKNSKGVVLLETFSDGKYKKVKCICPDCGDIFIMWSSHFYRGSNGCKCKVYNKRLYRIYTNMKTRCYNKHSPTFKVYGAKGITICDEWLNSYFAFEKWALCSGYKETLSIDRIDYTKGYYPENCRWVDIYTQASNKSNNVIIDGKCLKAWCREHGLNYKAITSAMYHSKLARETFLKQLSDKYRHSFLGQVITSLSVEAQA